MPTGGLRQLLVRVAKEPEPDLVGADVTGRTQQQHQLTREDFGIGIGELFGTFVLVPALLESPAATGYGFDKSMSQAGLFLLPTTQMTLVFGPLSGLLGRRYGPKLPLTLGAFAVTAAFALPAVAHGAAWQILVSGVLTGTGVGLAFAAMTNAIIETVPATATGQATSVDTVVRTIGGSIGGAVIGQGRVVNVFGVLSTRPAGRHEAIVASSGF